MMTLLNKFLRPPLTDDEQKRVATLLHILVLLGLGLMALVTMSDIVLTPLPKIGALLVNLGHIILLLIVASLLRRGYLRLSGLLLICGVWSIATLFIIITGIGNLSHTFGNYIIIILLSGFLLGSRFGFACAALCILSAWGLVWADRQGLLPTPLQQTNPISGLITMTAMYIVAAMLLYLAQNSLKQALEHARRTGQALAESNRELHLRTQALEQREAALRASEARWRSFVEHAPVLIVNADCAGIIEYSNDSVASEMVYGHSVYDFALPEYHAGIQTAIDHVLTTGETARYEAVGMTPSGAYHWHSVSVGPIRQDEETSGLMFIAIDIMERKRFEEALHASEQRYRIISDMSSDYAFAFRITPDDALVPEWMTDAFERLTGFTPEDIGRPNAWEQIVHPDDLSIVHRNLQRLLSEPSEDDLTFEARVVTKTHTVLYLRHIIRVEWDAAQGRAQRFYGASQNITERKRMEAALRESQRFAQSITEATPDLIYVFDFIHPRMVYINRSIYTMMGYSAEEAARLDRDPLYSLAHPDDVARVPELHRHYLSLRDGEVFTHEYRMCCANGEWRWFAARHIVFERDARGQARLILGTAQDITERKQHEAALQEYSERLEAMVEERTQQLRAAQEQLVRQERLAVLGQLAGGVAHELRNPLGVINNAVYFLKMVLSNADALTTEYLEIIAARVQDAEKIVADLLNISRSRPSEQRMTAVAALVDDVLRRQPPPAGVRVATSIPADLPPVCIDPRQIGQVLDNLVINAYQAMPDGGQLSLSVQAEQAQLRLAVGDTGVGIAAEHVAHIFEPLFSTKEHGIGLGLTVSQNLVEVNGGTLTVESVAGQGSTFTLTLPTSDAGL